jgi:predicted RNA binding protein YcfA (HicA-like mRNA interferase family)
VSLRNQSWRDIVKVLGKLGFAVKRQSGSHLVFEHPDGRWTVSGERELEGKPEPASR